LIPRVSERSVGDPSTFAEELLGFSCSILPVFLERLVLIRVLNWPQIGDEFGFAS
jgi:hypothetical protein